MLSTTSLWVGLLAQSVLLLLLLLTVLWETGIAKNFAYCGFSAEFFIMLPFLGLNGGQIVLDLDLKGSHKA